MEPGEPCRQVEDADARHHLREGFPHPLYAGHRRLHRAPAPRRAVAIASLSRRESLGAEGREQRPVAPHRVRLAGEPFAEIASTLSFLVTPDLIRGPASSFWR